MSNDFTLLQLGHPNLRLKAQALNTIEHADTQALFKRLLEFVKIKKGMGIAAPQVDISKRFFIMSSHPNARYPDAPFMEPTVIINPIITWVSDEVSKDWEGCLSIPGIRALVPRFNEIEVTYTLPNSDIIETRYSGFLARVFQHEYDHLDGIVFIDRVESTHDMMVESEWQSRIVNNF